jgi:hypothetical protein
VRSTGGRVGIALTVLTALSVAWGAFAFGAVYPWAFTPLAITSAVMGAIALVVFRHGRPPIVSLGLALTAVGAAIALQLVPLPSPVLDRLSPHADSFFGQGQENLGAPAAAAQPKTAYPLSIESDRTLVGLGLFASFALFLVGVARLTSEVGARRICFIVIGLGMVLAVVGIGQFALTINDKHPLIYGFWHTRFGTRSFGPFVNPNHFAGWMLMAMPLALGAFIDAFESSVGVVAGRRGDRRSVLGAPQFGAALFFAGAYSVMALSLLLTRSRSGVAAFLTGAALAAFVVVRHQRSRRARLAVVGVCAVLILGSLGWAGLDNAMGKFVEGDRGRASAGGRIGAWQDTLQIVSDFPLAGTGLDTFGTAMTLYQTERSLHYQEAHNDYLQLAAEGGLLVCVPVLVAFVIFVRDVRRRFREAPRQGSTYWIRTGAVIGLVSIAVQALVEFSLQMPGNTALFAVLAGLALHQSPNLRSARPLAV